MNRRYLAATIAASTIFASLFGAAAWLSPRPRLVWNASASAPIGLYRIDVGARPARGDLVAVAPPGALARFLDARRYVPRGTPLLKRIAAGEGATVCRRGYRVFVDGRPAALALPRDRAGRALPAWAGCRTLGEGEFFFLNAARASLDSRYFGSLGADRVIGIARPLLTRDTSGAPLRWRRSEASCSTTNPRKDP